MVSVIICTYNRAHYLTETLSHLLKQEISQDKFEVVLVNNNSTDNTESICSQFKSQNPTFPFRYFLEATQGLSYARNRGISESNGEILTFIDDDAFASVHFIECIVNHFSLHKNTIAIGGKIIPEYEEGAPKWMSKYLLPLVAALDMGDDVKKFSKGKFPIGANMSFRREAFSKYGEFDINLGRKGDKLEGSEEKDLFDRIMTHGSNVVYLPRAVVSHIIPAARVSHEYIKKQAIGIGKSESFRTKQQGQYYKYLFNEIVKWGGTIILSLMYLIMFQPAKAIMLIRFRAYVTLGILRN